VKTLDGLRGRLLGLNRRPAALHQSLHRQARAITGHGWLVALQSGYRARSSPRLRAPGSRRRQPGLPFAAATRRGGEQRRASPAAMRTAHDYSALRTAPARAEGYRWRGRHPPSGRGQLPRRDL